MGRCLSQSQPLFHVAKHSQCQQSMALPVFPIWPFPILPRTERAYYMWMCSAAMSGPFHRCQKEKSKQPPLGRHAMKSGTTFQCFWYCPAIFSQIWFFTTFLQILTCNCSSSLFSVLLKFLSAITLIRSFLEEASAPGRILNCWIQSFF